MSSFYSSKFSICFSRFIILASMFNMTSRTPRISLATVAHLHSFSSSFVSSGFFAIHLTYFSFMSSFSAAALAASSLQEIIAPDGNLSLSRYSNNWISSRQFNLDILSILLKNKKKKKKKKILFQSD